jgi:hypothetical protein
MHAGIESISAAAMGIVGPLGIDLSASRESIGSERRAASGIEAATARWASGDAERNRHLVDERDRLRAALEATKQLNSQRSEGVRIMSGAAGKRPSPTAQALGGLIAVGSHIDAACG